MCARVLMCMDKIAEVRGQLVGSSSSIWVPGSILGCQTLWQAPLPTELSK